MSEAAVTTGPGDAGRADLPLGIDEVGSLAASIVRNVETVIAGKREAITAALTVLLAEGHLLIEDVPGVGKTMLAKALARSVEVAAHECGVAQQHEGARPLGGVVAPGGIERPP